MKRTFVIGLGLATLMAIPAGAEQSNGDAKRVDHRHIHGHAQIARQPRAIQTANANGQGGEDGLSRNVEDCNKGCIGGNPK